jgi:fibronectin-binding autotransporter adhesin
MFRLTVASLAVFLVGATTAHGQTWVGGGSNGDWSTPANWNTGTIPSPGATISLAGSTNTATTLDLLSSSGGGPFDVAALSVSAGAGAFSINPTATNITALRIGASGIASSSANTLTIAAPITLGASQAWSTLQGGAIVVFGPVALGGNALTVGQNGVGVTGTGVTLSGGLSGSGGLFKAGGITLTVAGANTYTGPTTVQGGRLLVTGTLASGGVGVTVQTGGLLGGTGSVERAVIVQAAGMIQGGFGVTAANQVLTTGDLTFTNGGILRAVVSGNHNGRHSNR